MRVAIPISLFTKTLTPSVSHDEPFMGVLRGEKVDEDDDFKDDLDFNRRNDIGLFARSDELRLKVRLHSELSSSMRIRSFGHFVTRNIRVG